MNFYGLLKLFLKDNNQPRCVLNCEEKKKKKKKDGPGLRSSKSEVKPHLVSSLAEVAEIPV